MNALDRAIVSEISEGNFEIIDEIAYRFINVGALRLCKNVNGNRWHLVITSGTQVKLGFTVNLLLNAIICYAKRQK